jgi:lipopolysaccharide transport system permease protein
MATSAAANEVTMIRPAGGWTKPRLRDAWHHRELLYYFVARDLKVRYAQTLLGAFWTFFQPIGMMLVFTFAFRKLGRVQTEGVPYPIFVFAGLAFWTFFSRAVLAGADSLVANAALLTKTSLPRVLLPLAAIVSSIVDFLVTFVLLIGFAAWYGYYPNWRLLLVVPTMVVGVTLTLGMSLLLASVNVQWRDVRNILPMFVQLLLFASPVVYSLSLLGPRWAKFLAVNPLVGIVTGFRWSFLQTGPPTHFQIETAVGITLAALAAGIAYFGRVERLFADVA